MPHSILKKPQNHPDIRPLAQAERSQDERNRETAIYHANIIQHRKDTEAIISTSVEVLLELPSSNTADPACPCASDAALVKSSLKLFQPSDYDALIEERNINRLCGYLLCPRPNLEQDTQARYRILHGKGTGSDALRIVPTKNLEKWCSDRCGKRALYIKVQLNEDPAWTRAAFSNTAINLLGESSNQHNSASRSTGLDQDIEKLSIDYEERDITARLRTLAIERGQVDDPSQSASLRQTIVYEKPGSRG